MKCRYLSFFEKSDQVLLFQFYPKPEEGNSAAMKCIKFHHEVGYVHATPDKEEFQDLLESAKQHQLEAEDISHCWKERFPYLSLPKDSLVLWEKNAGHLSPRNLVEAQQKAAKQNGAVIIQAIVSTIRPSCDDSYRWDIITDCGRLIRGRNVLVAVGGSAALRPLFRHVAPKGHQPHIQLKTQTVSFIRIKEDEAKRLRDMPTFFTNSRFGDLDGGYALPPIKYPNGKMAIITPAPGGAKQLNLVLVPSPDHETEFVFKKKIRRRDFDSPRSKVKKGIHSV
ncbi:hypothetical protein SK128_023434 [Halocaridina rubra]|uniref:FAD dependent oxidoreductase domain-containing protein n=1 Tax=Halocaridina rubra TaxID=373956 RepID=A0AAN9A325_HALRR